MAWYSHLLKNFPQFVVIYTVKGFSIVNEAEVDFLEFSCFFYDPTDVDNLISSSSAFSKSRLNIWKFMLKPGLENFEHYFASMWDEYNNCVVVWTYFGIAFLWKGPQPYIYMYPFSPKLPSPPGCHIIDAQSLSCVRLFASPWTVTHQAHLWILQARILEWVAVSFSMGFSQLRDQNWFSCTASRFFTVWATGKFQKFKSMPVCLIKQSS